MNQKKVDKERRKELCFVDIFPLDGRKKEISEGKKREGTCFANSQETANAKDKVVSERDDRRTDAGP